MIKRLLWFAIGAAVGIFVIKKVRDYVAKARPEAIGQRLADQAGGLGDRASSFIDRARAAMAEREAELRDAIGQPQIPGSSLPGSTPTDDPRER
ncbi:hypothetical protein FOE78_13165 [Microlunatus elymi]|uniref:Secreted protein n=1 Tax=Microlunatus elymi TaxID=2596828 RepID=A0A516Q0K0_9ACTN|nr:hypothetical protein [Microlunatus elymi]QDP96731.1 hypothetical protein FOE78_13165 [Microlunatus elymi]